MKVQFKCPAICVELCMYVWYVYVGAELNIFKSVSFLVVFFLHILFSYQGGGLWKTKLIFLKLLFEQFSSSSFYLQKAFNVPYFEEKKCIRHVSTLSVYLQHKYPSVICVLINTCTVYRHKLAENMDKLLFHVLVNAQAMRCMVFSCASLFPSNAFLSLVKLMARICRG